MSERLCSALRKKVNDIETQLPALLEAKVLAISGTWGQRDHGRQLERVMTTAASVPCLGLTFYL